MSPGFQSATYERKHQILKYILEEEENYYTFTMNLVILQARQSNLVLAGLIQNSVSKVIYEAFVMINRPSVAGNVVQTSLSLTD